ncbi:hypothetical protein Dda3937_01609 [Dickeya dadantii 3937]|uniref:Uncharacterized protein n=1 Tax=Dickeya dadantii (strain 3937) TaxID=198628 RepID=E0SAV3_DICD3|nr:hypothetical protein Dda3937_01609 [Dickeya dadantii 3937]
MLNCYALIFYRSEPVVCCRLSQQPKGILLCVESLCIMSIALVSSLSAIRKMGLSSLSCWTFMKWKGEMR